MEHFTNQALTKCKSWESLWVKLWWAQKLRKLQIKLQLNTKWHLFLLWENFTSQALTKCKSQMSLWVRLWFITRDIQNS
jgi:hypothetical protein